MADEKSTKPRNPGGRPLKFKTVEELEGKAQGYRL